MGKQPSFEYLEEQDMRVAALLSLWQEHFALFWIIMSHRTKDVLTIRDTTAVTQLLTYKMGQECVDRLFTDSSSADDVISYLNKWCGIFKQFMDHPHLDHNAALSQAAHHNAPDAIQMLANLHPVREWNQNISNPFVPSLYYALLVAGDNNYQQALNAILSHMPISGPLLIAVRKYLLDREHRIVPTIINRLNQVLAERFPEYAVPP
jgi:hypothetical protein